jgi:hypothetical protein
MLVRYWVMIAAFLHCVCVGHWYQGTFVIHNVSGSFLLLHWYILDGTYILFVSSMCRKQLIFSYQSISRSPAVGPINICFINIVILQVFRFSCIVLSTHIIKQDHGLFLLYLCNSFRFLYLSTSGNINISLTQAVFMNQYANIMTLQAFLSALLSCHMLHISCHNMSWSLNHAMQLSA